MRWRFVPEDQTEHERAARALQIGTIDAFWRAWQRQALPLAQRTLRTLDAQLSLVPELAAEVDAARWVLRTEMAALEPLRQALFERAPADAYLPRSCQERLARPPRELTLPGGTLDLERTRVRLGVGRGHLLHIVVDPALAPTSLVDAASGQLRAAAVPEATQELCEDLVEVLLGEQVLSRWIGAIDVAPLPRAGSLNVVNRGHALSHTALALASLVDDASAGIVAGLPREAWHRREGAAWTLFELEPRSREQNAADYAEQDDVVLAASRDPELLKTCLEGAAFFSGRFSAHGEIFAYVKYASAKPAFEQRLLERDRLEAALHQELVGAQLGAVVGTGLGVRYSYVHVALSELSRALPLVTRVCQQLELPQACWLLFCDSEWRREWLGLQRGAPTPLFKTS